MERGLILFYLGSHPDHRGRLLADILAQDDLWLEVTHDYVQWLFPNRERSRVNPHAPVLTDKVVATFHDTELLKQHLRASFRRMLSFYGLTMAEDGIRKAANWDARKGDWFVTDTHNNLRITRILKCLRTLGLAGEAGAFHASLTRLRLEEADCGIGETAFRHWTRAMDAER